MSGYALCIHKCRDFAAWKKAYLSHEADRKAAGLTQVQLMHGTSDPNEVVILFKFEDMAKVKSFTESPKLKSQMDLAGVIGRPQIHFLKNGD